MNKLVKLTSLTFAAFGMSGVVFNANAAELSVDDIISKSNLASYYAGDDGSAQARMVIVDSRGQKQMRQFHILRKDKEDLGDQDMMVFFSRPTDVKDTVFRVAKKVKSDDDRWLYLPALDLVKRISAGDKRTSFVGSHFYYEDVSGRNPAEDNFTLIDNQSSDAFYMIKGMPKAPATVEFSYYLAEIDKQTFLPMAVTYYDNKDKPMREMKVLSVADVQGIPTVTHSKITQLSDNSYTEMQFRNVKYDVGLPDDVFSERSLRNPPKSWLN
ncbi:outer membrane lipoprotein-sorting protein [Colwellia sp. MEBiC06753]